MSGGRGVHFIKNRYSLSSQAKFSLTSLLRGLNFLCGSYFTVHCAIEEVRVGGWGALNNERQESVQHSEICSQPQIFYWFVINCTLNKWYAEEVCVGGGRFI